MTKNNLINIFKLLCIAIGILVLSKATAKVPYIYAKAFIKADSKFYIVKPYKNIPLKTILQQNSIVIGKNDIVSKDMDKPVQPFQTVKITRVSQKQKEIRERSPFRITWRRKYNSNLRTIELQKGVEKNITKTLIETFYDDILYETVTLNESTREKEFYRLLLFDKNGRIEKNYDLSKAKRIKMTATAYYPGDPLAWRDGTVTVLGQKMQRGIVAVDPKIIPLKTRLFITGYGYAYAGDTGSMIKGKRIDLGVNNAQEEKAWMHRNVTVYILEKSNTY
ncbi:MAG: 3D domain-containing protein [Endomicrobium sp.]|jgi:3D (Asp-Asp-Asp) domain-containing protein|nr:3D domain-containing protein [Endomicrobium sp.]